MLLNGSTHLAGYLALLIPPALGLILTLPRYHQHRQALLLWLGLAIPVEVFTLSRVGVLGLGVSLPVLALGWLWLTRPRPAEWLAGWRKMGLAARLGLVMAAIALLSMGGIWLQQSFRNRQANTDFRVTLWRAAVTILTEQPLLGAGRATFPAPCCASMTPPCPVTRTVPPTASTSTPPPRWALSACWPGRRFTWPWPGVGGSTGGNSPPPPPKSG
jgi:O-antigen ligase